MSLKQNAFNYMQNKACADRSKALASLDLLLEHAAGIGDHSTGDFYSNLDEALDILVDADDRLEKLKELQEIFGDPLESPNVDPPPF